MAPRYSRRLPNERTQGGSDPLPLLERDGKHRRDEQGLGVGEVLARDPDGLLDAVGDDDRRGAEQRREPPGRRTEEDDEASGPPRLLAGVPEQTLLLG